MSCPQSSRLKSVTRRRSRSRLITCATHECHEQWLKDDLAEAKSDGVPLWDGKAKLRARIALPDEMALFAEAKNNGQPSDGLMLVYLIELDSGVTDEQSVDPGAFPPDCT